MAYGMRASELAAVGKNVNKQGQGVSEESIQAAMDQELEQERKEAVSKHKERTSQAKAADAQQKAQLKSNMIQAVVDSGIKATTFAAERAAESPTAQAKQADRAAKKSAKKVTRLETKTSKLASNPKVGGKRLERAGTRLGTAKQQHAGAQFRAQEAYKKAYGKPGALYGKKPTVVQSESPDLFDKSVTTT